MTPEEFERLRAQWTVTQTKLYEVMYSTQYLQVPVEPSAFQDQLRTAHNAATAAWRAMDVVIEKYRRALNATELVKVEHGSDAGQGVGH